MSEEEKNTTQQEPAETEVNNETDQSTAANEGMPSENQVVENLENEVKDLKDQNLRLFAEFENFRKRTARERVELFSTANQDLMESLLPVLDDFYRAIRAEENPENTQGIKLILNKLENTLTAKGLKPMENCTGEVFDVERMEAISRIASPDPSMKGRVIDEVERGYYLGNKILRYAKVVVGE